MAKKTKREIMNLERLTSNIFNEFKKQTSIIKTEYYLRALNEMSIPPAFAYPLKIPLICLNSSSK